MKWTAKLLKANLPILQNNNLQTKHKNNNNCGSAFESGASGLPYYCTPICVRFGCTRLASCVDSKPKKKKFFYPVLTLSPLSKGTDTDMLTPIFFFLFSSSVSRHRVLSCRPRRTLPLSVKGGGSKGDTPTPHRSLLYRAQDSSWQVAYQSPPVDGETSLRHYSHPHAGILGTTRSSDLREMICAPTAEQEWLVKRGPGIDSHIGRRVRDGHLKGPGPNRT